MIKIKDTLMKGAILDMDGVLWRSTTPLCDLPQLFDNFRKHHIKVVLATNNGMHTISQYVEKFDGFGVQIESWQIVTSPMATAYLAKKIMPDGGPVFIFGSPALIETLRAFGFYHSPEEPRAVIAGLSTDFNYEKLKDAALMIQKGLPFFFTNPDPTYPTPSGNVPGAGTILAALETASGVKAQVAGKPMPFLFEVALQRMSLKPQEVFVVGDRLSTDILGGATAGCKTVFVLTGVNTLQDLKTWEPKPDLVIENIMDLFSLSG